MKIIVEGEPKEIAALIQELQERRDNAIRLKSVGDSLVGNGKQENGCYII